MRGLTVTLVTATAMPEAAPSMSEAASSKLSSPVSAREGPADSGRSASPEYIGAPASCVANSLSAAICNSVSFRAASLTTASLSATTPARLVADSSSDGVHAASLTPTSLSATSPVLAA